MIKYRTLIPLCLLASLHLRAYSQNNIELETIVIKGNKELPKILYIVPWQNALEKKKPQNALVLHSLFGDIFDPVAPSMHSTTANSANKHPLLSK